MKLVDDWKQCWRWVSMNCMVICASIQGTWMSIPDDLRESTPHRLVSGITVVILILGIIGRLLRQGDTHDNS